MAELHVRPMTADEFDVFRTRLVRDYAADHVRAGNWPEDEAQERAASQTDSLLPEREQTPGTLLLVAETADGAPVGHVWVGLNQTPAAGGAWIYDIEVLAGHRGQGYGRALLAAAEQETVRHGVHAMGLNVFGPNAVARGLYESAGYEITTLQMRKELTD
jgi:GNAT superfamily N-acetyltransferase